MPVTNQTIVTFQYTLYNTDGDVLENSSENEPKLYLHGANNIIRGLETAMTGRSAPGQDDKP